MDHGKTSYETALVAWQAWQKGRTQAHLSAPVQDCPYLAAVLAVCETRVVARAIKLPPYPGARCPGGSLRAVDAVVSFLSLSVVDAVYNEHCLGKVSESLESFFTRVQMGTAILVRSEQLEKSSPEALVGMITRAPVADLHAQADQHCDLSDPRSPVTSKMPHMSEVRMVSTLALKILEEPLFVEALQKEASAPIAKDDLVLLLAMHTNGWAVTNLVATDTQQEMICTIVMRDITCLMVQDVVQRMRSGALSADLRDWETTGLELELPPGDTPCTPDLAIVAVTEASALMAPQVSPRVVRSLYRSYPHRLLWAGFNATTRCTGSKLLVGEPETFIS